MSICFKLWLCIALCWLTACTFNSTYLNEESEKAKAEKVTDSLYGFVSEQNYIAAEKLFSDIFFAVTNPEGLLKIFTKTNEVLGNYKSKKLIEWKTRRIEGSTPLTEYQLVYEIIYQKYKAIETIKLQESPSGIKIVTYNINSDGFLK